MADSLFPAAVGGASASLGEAQTADNGVDAAHRRRVQLAIKRVMDIAGALVMLLVTWPVMLITAIAIKLDSRGPIFFLQDRVGQDGRTVRIIKFRSMVTAQDRHTEVSSGAALLQKISDQRVTRVGRFIRRWAIDELPQAINILFGDLSLIGPRSRTDVEVRALIRQFAGYRQVLAMPQGLTGWQQVQARGSSDASQVVALDREYVRDWSLWLDIRIVILTIAVIVSGRGSH